MKIRLSARRRPQASVGDLHHVIISANPDTGEIDVAALRYERDLEAARECDDRRYVAGCGEYDTTDSRGVPLRNGGRTFNEAGEPWWM